MTITLNIPPEHEQTFLNAWGASIDRAAYEALVIEGYRCGKFGAATASLLLGHASRLDTERWLAQRGVPVNYSIDDLRADRETLAQIFGKSA